MHLTMKTDHRDPFCVDLEPTAPVEWAGLNTSRQLIPMRPFFTKQYLYHSVFRIQYTVQICPPVKFRTKIDSKIQDLLLYPPKEESGRHFSSGEGAKKLLLLLQAARDDHQNGLCCALPFTFRFTVSLRCSIYIYPFIHYY